MAASTAKPPRPQPGGQGTGRPGRVGICLPPPILLRLPGHHRASPGDGNRPPASGRSHPSGIVVVCRFPVSDLAVAVCALSLAMVFLRPIHLGHREGIVRIALPLSPWNRKRSGSVWENPALLSRDVPEVGPRGCAKPPKTLARPNQAPSGDTVDHRRHGRSLRGRHIPLWHSQSASASGARLSLCHGVGLAAGGLCLSAGAGELLLPATAESFLSPGSALDGGRNPHHPGWAHLPGGVPSPVHPHRLSLRRPVAFKPLGRSSSPRGAFMQSPWPCPAWTRQGWFRPPSDPACSCAREHRCGGCL